MARRGKNEGTIVQRGDGRWEAKLTIGGGGKRRRKSFSGKTRREVQERLTRALRDQHQGLPVRADERQTVGEFLETRIGSVRSTVRPSTYVSYAGHVRLHLRPALERVPLAKLTPVHLRELLAAKLASGLSPRTVQYVQAVLRAALNQALRDGLVARNVAMLVAGPRVRRHEISPLRSDVRGPLRTPSRGFWLRRLRGHFVRGSER
jgi:integrase